MKKSSPTQAGNRIRSKKRQSDLSGLPKYWQLGLFALLNLFIFFIIFNSIYPIKYSAVGLYFNDASRILNGALIYRDFTFEYPPLAALFFLLPRLITDQYPTYSILFHTEVVIFVLAGLWILFDIACRLGKSPWKLLSIYTLSVLVIGPILGEQFDIFPAVITLLSLYFFWLGKIKTSWILLGLGTMVKIYPAVIAPIYLLCYLRNRQKDQICQGIISFGLTCLAIALPILIISPVSLVNFLNYHSNRGLQLESMYSALLLVGDKLGLTTVMVDFSAGSWNIDNPLSDSLAKIYPFILSLAMLIVYWFIYKQIKPGKSQFSRLGAYSLLAILTTLIFSKILSPQYLIWLLPLIPLLFVRWRNIIWIVFALIGILTYYIFPIRYIDLMALDTIMIIVLFIRDLMLILMALLIGISLYRMKPSD